MDTKAQLLHLKEEIKKETQDIYDEKILNEIKVKYLGKKGLITSILKSLGNLSPEERREVGQLANSIKEFLEEVLKTKQQEIAKKKLEEMGLSLGMFK